jgi:hypothetical protein
VGDRHEDPHNANLFDINAKYGDVISKAEAIRYLQVAAVTLQRNPQDNQQHPGDHDMVKKAARKYCSCRAPR